ncbi:restriction endonuclease subunit S [Tenacibaculum finnmarkense genomovar ulcerans]|uniref:restriction endonuclease subunit S n=1 Tax=Tenacibaculum finnmarkense TaxID=2781243 RepID=UPI001E2915BF|nr:restriction endonuclease subunit S [Tenacibaculum finnmarkense]MCD8430012.1 restriction endonuclease subunit S [Tenacibaculum finnmarkense genomovar ulcerans]
MEKYKKYKNSGIDWLLDEIPNHWETKRIKDLCKMQSGFYISANDFQDEGFPIYGGNGFRGFSKDYNHNGEYTLIGRQGALCGNVNYAKGKFWATEHAIVVYEKKRINKFWFGELLRLMNLNQYSLSAAQPGLSVEKIKRLKLPFIPKLKEQTEIANYLDAKTQTIDKKVKLLSEKISTYKDYRKTLINQTVTKGLDKNVSNWINYRLKNIGYLYSGLSGKSGNDFNQENNPNNKGFIPFTNIANNTYLNQNHLGTVVIEEKEKQNQVKKNDIFFLMSSEGYEDIGKSAVLIDDIKETYLNSFCKGFRIINNNCEASFINYLLLSDFYRQKMLVQGKGFTRINLKMEKINNFSILIPPTKKEQQAIANYLDAKTQTIDTIIKNIENQITTLKELRKTLINEVVTGKVKITG